MNDPKYFEKYYDLFLHPGWIQFMKEVKESAESINLAESKNWEMFLVMKTKKDCFSYILEVENLVKAVHENQTAQANDSL